LIGFPKTRLLMLKINMTPKSLQKSLLLPLGLIVFFSLTASGAIAGCPNETKPSGAAPLQMLVLGDSIM